VTDEDELSTAPYIVEGVEKRLIAGVYEDMYVRRLETDEERTFRVFRGGRKFIHPKTGEHLGYEAIHVGDSRLKKFGDTSRIGITMTHTAVDKLDRLRPFNGSDVLPYYFPRSHESADIQGYVMPKQHRSIEFGTKEVIAITLGNREGVKEGHVFKIVTDAEQRIDPLTKEPYLLPSEQAGLAMVFRVFDKISYALITDRERVIEAGDLVVHPDARVSTYDAEHPFNVKRQKIQSEGNRFQKWMDKKRHGEYGEKPSLEGTEKYGERKVFESKLFNKNKDKK